MVIGTYILIITLNVNGLNVPTKRHRLAEWIQNKTHIYIVYRRPTSVAILISEKIDFKTNTLTRNKERHYIMIKGSIQEEDRTFVIIFAPNIGAPQYITQILTVIKGEIDSNTIIVGAFNTPL